MVAHRHRHEAASIHNTAGKISPFNGERPHIVQTTIFICYALRIHYFELPLATLVICAALLLAPASVCVGKTIQQPIFCPSHSTSFPTISPPSFDSQELGFELK